MAVIAFSLVTTLSWMTFERDEMEEMDLVLEALPQNQRVIGVSFVPGNDITKHNPLMQAFSYTRVAKGGTLNFSFADFHPSLVVYKKQREKKWTKSLEWFPTLFKPSDCQYFDYLVLNATEKMHLVFETETFISAITDGKRWQLYKVDDRIKIDD